MVKHSMDLLELLRKRGIDGDVDFLREALRVLVDGIMDAEVSAQIGAQHGERSHRIIDRGEDYVDLGYHYFEQRDRDAITRRAVRQLERLGHNVTLQAA